MSREIKFRAWMEDVNADWKDEDRDDEYQMIYDFAFEEYNTVNDMLRLTENLMQHIGLKDKNGVEIYEGDIVATSTKKWVIEKREDNEFCGFLPVEIGLKQGFLSTFIRYDALEIIGNIYENEDLLK